MQSKIMILTVTKCSPKDKDPYTRVDFISLDKQTKSENVKGHIVSPTFYEGHSVFDKITNDYLNQEITADFEYVPSVYKPGVVKIRYTKLTNKNGTVDLL